MARLIDADALTKLMCRACNNECCEEPCEPGECFIYDAVSNAPTVDAVELPCKIGDFVWAIRSFQGHKHPQRGIVSDMFFTKNMKLMIVVKYVARGEWGKTVFATDKEAYAAIGERIDGE